jgi:hypothetical protein
MKRKRRWIYVKCRKSFEDVSTKGKQDLPKLDRKGDEEEPGGGYKKGMKRKSRWKGGSWMHI